jgi:membrane-associated phospholipid phosphatase
MSQPTKNNWPLWWSKNHARAIALFLGIFLPLLLLAGLAEDIWDGEILPFDKSTLLYIRQWQSPSLDSLMLFFSTVGGPNVMTGLTVLIFGLLLLRRPRSRAIFFAAAMLGELLLNQGVKLVFARPRPTLWERLVEEHAFSFPSGHAMGSTAFVTAVVLLLWYTSWRWPALILGSILVLLICFSRLYLGVHYPSDVLGGMLASLAWVVGLRQLFRQREHIFRQARANPIDPVDQVEGK